MADVSQPLLLSLVALVLLGWLPLGAGYLGWRAWRASRRRPQ